MERKIVSFAIGTELTHQHLEGLLGFIEHYYILPNPERFRGVRKTSINGDRLLAFTAVGPEAKWLVDVEMRARKPIQVKMIPSGETVPRSALGLIRNDLVIAVQLFEEKVRKTTLYFAWVKGEKIIPETIPSRPKRSLARLFTETMIPLYIILIGASIFLFMILGFFAPLVIIALQLFTVLISDRIVMRLGQWTLSPKNPTVHLLQYNLPVEEYRDLHKRYGRGLVQEIKRKIYERTLALGKEPDCQLAEEVFSEYGVKCVPENLSTKAVNLYQLVEKAAGSFDLPVPKVVVSNSMLPNAAASGPSPGHGTVLITTGLLVQLEEDEIFSVVGHELGHLKGRDPLILFGLSASEFLLRVYVFWPFVRSFFLLYFLVAMGVVYFIAKFFEARADLESAVRIGKPKLLAEALRKIGFRKLQFEREPAHRIQSWLRWDPHPPTYFRINRLEKLESPTKAKHSLLQSVRDVINGFRAAL